MGGALIQSVPINGMVMRLSGELLSAVRGLDFVRWAGWYHPAYALAFTLAGRDANRLARLNWRGCRLQQGMRDRGGDAIDSCAGDPVF